MARLLLAWLIVALTACGTPPAPTAPPPKPTEVAKPAAAAPAAATSAPAATTTAPAAGATTAPAAATKPATGAAPTPAAGAATAPAAAAATKPAEAAKPAGSPAAAAPAAGAPLKNVPRNRTLVSQGWDTANQVPSPTNFHPYLAVTGVARNSLHYTMNESLFYTNYNNGQLIPWLAEKFEWNRDYTELTVAIRKGVKWADGQPFTAKDVAFTLNLLKDNAPTLALSAAIKESVATATASDDQTVKIKLTKPNPRWANDIFAQGQATRFHTLPEHVWKDKDAKTFEFYDPAKGWPFGTGPYRLARTGNDSIVYDRADSWWAKDVGLVKEMPAVERVIYKPAASEAVPNLFINNDIDLGTSIQKGLFEAGRARNPNLISWNESGPVWGSPDGCNFRLIFNTQKKPYDDPEVRWAFNHAINRDQVSNLAYEGGMPKNTTPFSSYGGMQKYVAKLKDIFDKAQIDNPNPSKTAEILTRKGFKKDAQGRWAMPDGAPWPVTILMGQGNPIGPVLVEQLKAAGFDAVFKVEQGAALADAVAVGNFETNIGVLCGSIDDPWQTLRYFHGKHAPAPGEKITEVRANTRYKNAELDGLLDKMESMVPSPDDAAYMDLARKATEIFVRDMPSVILAEEFHVIVMNQTYWTGWPTAKDPYIAPYPPWEGYALVIQRLRPKS